MSDRLKRAYEVSIKVGGDTWKDVIYQLRYLLPHIEDHGPVCDSVSGSPSSNHVVVVHHDPEMTHERYFELLEEMKAKPEETP